MESVIGIWDKISEQLRVFFVWCGELFSSIPLFVYIAFVLGIALSVGALYLAKYLVTRQNKSEPPKENVVEKYKLPPLGGWISEFLVRKGFFKVGRMSSLFLNGLDFLERAMKCSNYKYKNPWVLLVGATGSGKSTLIQNFDSINAIWKEEVESYDAEYNWVFLRNGVALDVKGALFLEQKSITSDEVGWTTLRHLLSRYRSARPIDSIVLTISAEDLYGKNRIPSNICTERAHFIFQKLSLFQDQLGLKIPIYVVITKTDIVPGFQEFCKNLPAGVKGDMFGWSNPYNVDAEYMHQWVDEAIGAISSKIADINMDICCQDALNQVKDGLYVFPYELEKVRENLAIYLDQIFKATAYEATLLLRGIYFVGDGGEVYNNIRTDLDFIDESLVKDAAAAENAALADEEQEVEEPEAKSNGPSTLSERLFFCRDVLDQKVLSESLCIPQKWFFNFANKSLRIAKITAITLIVVGIWGGSAAYLSFKRTKESVVPAISSMYRFLVTTQQIPITELSKKNDAFEAAVKQLSNIMQELSTSQLFSIFIPASWFSPLRSKLDKSVNLAYQNVVMRALYVNLMLKARELLHMAPHDIKPNTSIAQLAIPTKSNEFKAIKDFVDGLTQLASFVDKFNDLRLVASPAVLAELVEYAFHMTLSTSFLKYYGNMRRKLNTSAFPEIDLMAYKGLARKTLSDLFQEFFNTIFIYSHPNSFPAQMDNLVRQLRNLDAKGLPDCDFLRTLSIELNAVIKTFEPPESASTDTVDANVSDNRSIQTWMDKDVFEPDSVFEDLLCSLDKSSFFGEDVSQAIVNNCAVGLFHLKQRLRELTKILTTDVRFAPPPEGAEEETARASEGLFLLARSLKTLFDEPYMRKPSAHRFINSVPEGQVLYWDDKLLQTAKDLCEQYEAFSTKKIGGFPVILQESFRLIARGSLQKNLASLIAQAQNFIPMPVLHNEAATEELIRSRTANLRLIYPEMLKLLEILNYESVSFFYISLRDLLLETNYELLTQLNELLKRIGPYHIWDPSFSWWDGKSSPAYHAYGVKDSQDLNSFLNIQSQQVINLAINLAKPVIDFLTSDIMLSVNPLDNTKLTKWRRIVDQATAFQKKQPGNSIADLETFITTEFKEYSMENAFEKINTADIQVEVGDYFLETKQYIKKGILGRVEILTRQKNIKNYQDLAFFFNKHLKGRFPFTPPSTDVSQSAEADPEDVRLFFEKFKTYGGTTEKILNQIYQLGSVSTEAAKFLRSVEQVFSLFKEYLETNNSGLPSTTMSIEFNINRDRAVCSNYVAQWTMRTNRDEIIQNTDKNKRTKWVYDSQTDVSFRWPSAKGLLEVPLNDPKQPALKVLQTTATFSYKGKWSILRMVRQHRANKGEYVPMFNPNSVVLKFVIPVSESKSAILFNSLTFSEPSTNPNMLGKDVPFPEFPIHAPGLSEEIERYRNEPVLGFGVISASPLN